MFRQEKDAKMKDAEQNDAQVMLQVMQEDEDGGEGGRERIEKGNQVRSGSTRGTPAGGQLLLLRSGHTHPGPTRYK